ncbi:MAG: DUF3105 domain-containing protein [Gaiellaceae bacterium]
MAKKSRTPQPPRRVQAPKQRKTETVKGPNRLLIGGLAGAAIVVAGAIVLAVVVLRGDGTDATLRAAGCTIEKQPAMAASHVEQLEEGFEYNTTPPSSGPHYPIPAIWDVYTEPVEQFRLVHNLEHGAMVVQYGRDVTEATVAEIVEWYRDDPNGIIVAPLPSLGDQIALAAWTSPDVSPGQEPAPGQGVLAECPGFDPETFDAFKDEYAFRGPERFPRERLLPGT